MANIFSFKRTSFYLLFLLLILGSFISWRLLDTEDPLPSWEEGMAKKSIIEFVTAITQEGGEEFIPAEERIAVFNHDGTLWPELPPAEGVFVLKHVKAMIAENPKLKNKKPFKEISEKDIEYFEKGGTKSVIDAMVFTHGNKTQEEFRSDVDSFFRTEKHPRYRIPFLKLAYKPMAELLAYLRSNGFKTWICCSGSIEFVRVISNEMYGIPPEQVIGSRFETEFVDDDRKWLIRRKAKVASLNDKNEKPVNICNSIGRKPIFTCGNVKSGTDLAMLTYGDDQTRPSFQMIINHNDGINEFTYEDAAKESLKAAKQNEWTVVNIKNDWRELFIPSVFEKEGKIKLKSL
jgi:phosphoserine phosphatase